MNQWRAIHRAFEHALSLASDERDVYLRQLEADESTVAEMVKTLLAADAAAEKMTPTPVPDDTPPTRVGPYRIRERIGRGGMSDVYRVRRDDAFKRVAALKILRSGTESDAAAYRLRREREILANLDHPAIARLFDGGTTENGRPFFVMEYIEGVSIDRYCDDRSLRVADRIALFRRVLDAVQYAHERLVVHRDLKPSNILVTTEGQPKLVDFGISEVLNAELAGGEGDAPESRGMTPGYASPEQRSGNAATATDDVFALGVLLSKLLVDLLPDARPEDQTDSRMLPSRAAAMAPSAVLEARQSSRRRLQKTLAGDLDAIVDHATASAADQRYRSVESFAEDLDRYQRAFPIAARPASVLLRAGKFFVRHAKSGVVAVLVGVSLVWALLHAGAERHRLHAESEALRIQRDSADGVIDLTEQILGRADPAVSGGRAWTVQAAVEASGSVLDASSADPAVVARLRGTLGRILLGLGDAEAAADHFATARDLLRQEHGDDSVAAARAASALASAWVASGAYARGEALALESVQRLRGREGAENDLLVALNAYVTALCAEGNFERADGASLEAVALAERLGRGDASLERSFHNRARLLNQRGEPEAARDLYRRVLRAREMRLTAPHPSIASTQVNLAMTLERLDQHEEAKGLLEGALEQQRTLFGGAHPDQAPTLNNLAVLYLSLGEEANAEAAYRSAIDLFEEDDVQGFRLRIELAALLDRRGQRVDAEALLRSELARWRPTLNSGNTMVAWAENTLGAVLTGQGRYEEARRLLDRSLPLIRERRGPDDAYTRKAERRWAEWQARSSS